MLTTTHKRPWTRPLNWNLHVTLHGEPCIPFSLYVQPEPTRSSCPTFPQFPTLPNELQLHVLRFCDGPTLFQLMQVSSATRSEAEKLFWSYPGAWYYVDGNWLLAGGFPGHAHHAMDFLAHVEQVEVDFDQIKCLREDREAQISGGPLLVPSHHVKERIRGFWQILQQRCPRATRVIVSESKARRAGESLPHDLKMMVQMCPVGISASASLLQEVAGCWGQLERSLWRLVRRNASTPGAWEKTNPTWTRQSILLPPKEFRGPVGLYERARYKFRRYSLQKEAARLLLIEALERHHFHGRHEPCD